MGLKHRVKKLEAAMPSVPMLTTYHCIIDGKPEVMTALDFAYITAVEGKQGTMGRIAGAVPIDPPDPGALDRAFEGL